MAMTVLKQPLRKFKDTMNLSRTLFAAAVLAAGAGAALPAFAEGFNHEFSVSLPVRTVIGGGSDSRQAVDYTYYLSEVESPDYPFAEEAFIARTSHVSVALSGESGETTGGSSKQWGYSLTGRYLLPDTPYFAEAAFSHMALSIDPYVLSNAANIDASLNTLGLLAGMYATDTIVIDLSITRGQAEFDSISDIATQTVNLHGKSLWRITDRLHAAFELAVSRTSVETGSDNTDSTGYVAKATSYFSRTLSASFELGRITDENDPSTEYRFQDINITWYIEPEVMVSLDLPLDVMKYLSDEDYDDPYTALRILQRF